MPSYREFLYGKIAVANHVISPEQLDTALEILQVLERYGLKAGLADVLIKEKFLKSSEADVLDNMIQRARQSSPVATAPKPTQQDVIFARIAVKNNLCTKEQAETCFKALQSGGVYRDIATIMIQQGILTRETANAIFRAWRKKVDEKKARGLELPPEKKEDDSGIFKVDQALIRGGDVSKTPWLASGKRAIQQAEQEASPAPVMPAASSAPTPAPFVQPVSASASAIRPATMPPAQPATPTPPPMRSPFAPKNTPLPTRPTPPLTSVSLSKNPTEKVSEDILLESAEIKTTPIWPATAASVEGPEDLESSGIFTITPLRMSPEEASRELDSQEMNVIRATASTQSPREDHAVVLPAVSPTPAPPAAPSAAEREILERQKKIREEADLFKKAEERIVKAIQVYCRSHPHLAVLEYFHDTHSNVTSVLKVANRVDMKEKEVKKIFQDFMIGGILRNVSNTVVHFAPSDEDAQAIKEIVTFWRNKRYHNQVLKWMATHGNG